MNGADDRYTAAMGNYELLVRGIMDLPNKPAIINLQYVPFFNSFPSWLLLFLAYPPSLCLLLNPSRSHDLCLPLLLPYSWDELTNSIFALMFRQLALGGDMVSSSILR
jgi:hypothetical protein